MPAHIIGGEYVSRANAGDPHASTPLQPVSRGPTNTRRGACSKRALFSDAAWRFNPRVLRMLTYREVSSLGPGGTWVYDPSPRHDVDVVAIAGATQERVLDELFAPLTLGAHRRPVDEVRIRGRR